MQAEKNAEQFKNDFVSVEHLFMALIDEKGIPSAKIFANHVAVVVGLDETPFGFHFNTVGCPGFRLQRLRLGYASKAGEASECYSAG